MKYLTLNIIKAHLQINTEFTGDDTYLTMLGGAVEEVVEKHIDDSLAKLAEDNDDTLPLPLIQAMLLLLGTYYSNRENIAYTSAIEVPMSYTYLLDLYRNYGGGLSESEMILELKAKVDQLMSYMNFDNSRTLSSTTLSITTANSGQTTTINVDEIDGGDY